MSLFPNRLVSSRKLICALCSSLTSRWIYRSLLDHLPKAGEAERLEEGEEGVVGEGDALLMHFSDEGDEDDEPLARSKTGVGR